MIYLILMRHFYGVQSFNKSVNSFIFFVCKVFLCQTAFSVQICYVAGHSLYSLNKKGWGRGCIVRPKEGWSGWVYSYKVEGGGGGMTKLQGVLKSQLDGEGGPGGMVYSRIKGSKGGGEKCLYKLYLQISGNYLVTNHHHTITWSPLSGTKTGWIE